MVVVIKHHYAENVKVDFSALESTSAGKLKETKEMNQTNKRLLRQNEAY